MGLCGRQGPCAGHPEAEGQVNVGKVVDAVVTVVGLVGSLFKRKPRKPKPPAPPPRPKDGSNKK